MGAQLFAASQNFLTNASICLANWDPRSRPYSTPVDPKNKKIEKLRFSRSQLVSVKKTQAHLAKNLIKSYYVSPQGFQPAAGAEFLAVSQHFDQLFKNF